MRCAIYARYSSDLQNPRSIADQLADCRRRAATEGWIVVAEFTDEAISAASVKNRPGVLEMLRAADLGAFDIMLCEHCDRLSRDQEDLAAIYKRLTYRSIIPFTLADGEVTKLHVGLRGLVGSIFLDDLAQKTRRGLVGRFNANRSTGGRTYGYRSENGELRIVPEEAEIVRRIFREYADGRSPIAIVTDLNRERVPSPRGGEWGTSTINGSRKRASGILYNRLYIGEATFGRQKNVTDPATGQKQKQSVEKGKWITKEIAELAIVDRAVFEVVQDRRRASCQVRLCERRRPKHVLSGLVKCAVCGGNMAITYGDRLACSVRKNKGTCSNARTISVADIECRVLSALQMRLLEPEVVEAAVEAYRAEMAKLASDRAKTARRHDRQLTEVDRKINSLLAAIEGGAGDLPAIARRLRDLEAEREELLRGTPEPIEDDVLALHPNAAKRYRAKVADLRSALAKGDAAGTEAVNLVRRLISRIIATPTEGEMQLVIEGDLAIMLEQERAMNSGTAMLVPPPRIERGTSRSTI